MAGIGEISVDSSGWGTMALHPPESLYGYDWMNLTVDEAGARADGSAGEMVLQTRIISPGAQLDSALEGGLLPMRKFVAC